VDRYPEAPGQRRERVQTIGITAPPFAVRERECHGPWLHGLRKRMPTDAQQTASVSRPSANRASNPRNCASQSWLAPQARPSALVGCTHQCKPISFDYPTEPVPAPPDRRLPSWDRHRTRSLVTTGRPGPHARRRGLAASSGIRISLMRNETSQRAQSGCRGYAG
jgi:hypothetical protein